MESLKVTERVIFMWGRSPSGRLISLKATKMSILYVPLLPAGPMPFMNNDEVIQEDIEHHAELGYKFLFLASFSRKLEMAYSHRLFSRL